MKEPLHSDLRALLKLGDAGFDQAERDLGNAVRADNGKARECGLKDYVNQVISRAVMLGIVTGIGLARGREYVLAAMATPEDMELDATRTTLEELIREGS